MKSSASELGLKDRNKIENLIITFGEYLIQLLISKLGV